jgi:hypothetical protein
MIQKTLKKPVLVQHKKEETSKMNQLLLLQKSLLLNLVSRPERRKHKQVKVDIPCLKTFSLSIFFGST